MTSTINLNEPTKVELKPDVTAPAIIRKYQSASPVDVVGIAKDLGLAVWELKSLPGNISGKIWKDPRGGPSGYSIGVNTREHLFRKRFTIAHEIGHFVLHRNKLTNELIEDTMYRGTGMSSVEEKQANQFAADMLMPFPLIQRLLKAGMTDVKQLATELQVSEPAMRIRLGFPVP